MSKNGVLPPKWCCRTHTLEQNAMKTLSRFVTKFTSLIVAVLSCFDRVIIKGYLPITNGPALEGFVDYVLKIRRCDFMAFAEEQSETLVDFAKRLAQEAGAEYRFLQGYHRKDKLVDSSRSKIGRFVRPSELAQDPQPPGSPSQSFDKRAMVSRLQLLLGHRPGRVRHRSDLHQPRGVCGLARAAARWRGAR
jgi:hypothetical protein